jgi:hypothetical protein
MLRHTGASFEAVLEPVVFNIGKPNAEATVFCDCRRPYANARHCMSIGGGPPGEIISRTSFSALEGTMRPRTRQSWDATRNGLLYLVVRQNAKKKIVMSALS